jgi:pimeloyl-ACP methyl ester carboxylesterase
VDLRGQGGSSGDWLTYGVVESRDLMQVLDALAARGLLAGRVGALGYSYGAAVAIEHAAADHRVEAVVALAPFSSLRDAVHGIVRRWLPIWGWLASDDAIERAISEAGRRAGFDPSAASPRAALRAVRAHVLLLHGDADLMIPAAHSRGLHEAAPETTRLIELEGIGHDAILQDPGGRVSAESLAWLDRWLGGPEPSPYP